MHDAFRSAEALRRQYETTEEFRRAHVRMTNAAAMSSFLHDNPVREVARSADALRQMADWPSAMARQADEVRRILEGPRPPAAMAHDGATFAGVGRPAPQEAGSHSSGPTDGNNPPAGDAKQDEVSSTTSLGTAEEHRLLRDGDRDVVFRGWKLGQGYVVGGKFDGAIADGTYERETEVTLYLTEGRNFIIHEKRLRSFGDMRNDAVRIIPVRGDEKVMIHKTDVANGGPRVLTRTEAEVSPGERLLLALSEGGSLGTASRDAWNEACKNYPPLRVLETERID